MSAWRGPTSRPPPSPVRGDADIHTAAGLATLCGHGHRRHANGYGTPESSPGDHTHRRCRRCHAHPAHGRDAGGSSPHATANSHSVIPGNRRAYVEIDLSKTVTHRSGWEFVIKPTLPALQRGIAPLSPIRQRDLPGIPHRTGEFHTGLRLPSSGTSPLLQGKRHGCPTNDVA